MKKKNLQDYPFRISPKDYKPTTEQGEYKTIVVSFFYYQLQLVWQLDIIIHPDPEDIWLYWQFQNCLTERT